MLEVKNSYDLIAQAVRDYVAKQLKNDQIIDDCYIVHFYQKYEWSKKWDECTEIVFGNDLPDGVIQFASDFCEGETEVKNVVVYGLNEIGDIISFLGPNM